MPHQNHWHQFKSLCSYWCSVILWNVFGRSVRQLGSAGWRPSIPCLWMDFLLGKVCIIHQDSYLENFGFWGGGSFFKSKYSGTSNWPLSRLLGNLIHGAFPPIPYFWMVCYMGLRDKYFIVNLKRDLFQVIQEQVLL